MMKRLVLVYLLLSMSLLFTAFSSSADVHLIQLSFHPHHSRSCVTAIKQFTSETSRLKREYMIAGEAELRDTKKVAYLTFDDGPNRYTTQILNILQKKQAKATFFLIGSQVQRRKDIVSRIAQEGHYIGLHSMSHDPKKLYGGTPDSLIQEMEQEKALLNSLIGYNTDLIRVPYGSMPYLNDHYRDALSHHHFKMWDWTVDTNDWENKHKPFVIIQTIRKHANDREEVILLHDKQTTVQALPQIIDYLRSKGYTLLEYNPYHHIRVNFWKDERL
ncbi:polysaccharide deacetylase family protein [Bacillus sp. 165]|uniref:polysaccharide deacetylase family protein n=1 Tax=Bacillus sp. 165 TaxID=1529117 RepID=UPI001ADCF764|nr:polysaccharide deacetylase family protein [Bacillus sp. 165]MBO9129960.1 polysaccharide deacetylase [Bacillus sp. 165]